MTDETIIDNVTFSRDGTTITIYTETVEDVLTKDLGIIKIPQGSANADTEPKETRVIDLQKFLRRLTIKGHVVNSEVGPLKALSKLGGTVVLTFDANGDGTVSAAGAAETKYFGGTITINETINVVIDKIQVKFDSKRTDDHQDVDITCVEGNPF